MLSADEANKIKAASMLASAEESLGKNMSLKYIEDRIREAAKKYSTLTLNIMSASGFELITGLAARKIATEREIGLGYLSKDKSRIIENSLAKYTYVANTLSELRSAGYTAEFTIENPFIITGKVLSIMLKITW